MIIGYRYKEYDSSIAGLRREKNEAESITPADKAIIYNFLKNIPNLM